MPTTSVSRENLGKGSRVSWPVAPVPAPFRELHGRQSTRRLSSVEVPPRESGTMWSHVRSSLLPHSLHHGCALIRTLRLRKYCLV